MTSKTARAMIFVGPRQPLVSRSFSLPELAAGEVLVEVTFATLCGSDLHTYQGRRQTPCPTILGHEILGAWRRCRAKGASIWRARRWPWATA